MKQFKNILLVLNGQESDKQSLRRAAGLAQRNDVSLGLIEVIQAPIGEFYKLRDKLKGRDLSELLIDDRKARMRKLLKATRFPLLSMDVMFGIPFIEIIRHVQRHGFDLLIMAAEGKGGVKEKLFGATSLHLMRQCPCPVWILKPTQVARYRKILAAVDLIEPDPVKDGLNRKIVELATSMAETEKGELHLVHVWDFVWESLLVTSGGMNRQDVKAAVKEFKEKHRQALEKLNNEHPVREIRRISHLLRGNAGEVIPKCAEKIRADLIVMGTVCRQGIAGFLIGNTAEQVLQRVNASVLTVKPEGFVSPVK